MATHPTTCAVASLRGFGRLAILVACLGGQPLLAQTATAEPALFRSRAPVPDAALEGSGGGCVYFRGSTVEWASAPDANPGTAAPAGLLAFGNVQALRFEGTPLRLMTEGFAPGQQLAVEPLGSDRVVIDLRVEVDHGCVLKLERFALDRVVDPAPRIAQILLVEQMANAIQAAQRSREDLDHAGSARNWARALAVRDELGLQRDAVALQIDQQRIQSWALASLPVPAEEAQALVDQAAAILGPEHAVTANTYTALGWTLRKHGRHAEALAGFRRAHALTARTQGTTYRATLRLQQTLASQLLLAGQRTEALALFEDAYRHRVELLGADHEETWRVLAQLTEVYAELGRNEEAEQLARQGYERFRASLGERHRMTIFALAVLVDALLAAERNEDALPLLESEVAARAEVPGTRSIDTLVKLGEVHLKLGRLDAARATLQRATGMEAALPRNAPRSDTLPLVQARLLAAAGETGAARAEYARLLVHFEQRLGAANRLSLAARFESASLASRAGDDDAAGESFAAGIATLERLRAEGGMSVEARQALLATYADAYRRAAWVAHRRGRAEEVLRLAELSKARTLLDTLTQRRAEASAGLAPADQARVKDLAERINAMQAQALAATHDAIQRAALEVRKNDLVRELAGTQAELRARSPTYARLSTVQLVDRAERARSVVPADVAFVSYVIVPAESLRGGAGASLLALVIRRQAPPAVIDLGNADALAQDVARYRALLGADATAVPRPGGAAEANAGRDLAARWLAPLRPWLRGFRRLVIAPDGPLAILPFEALPWGNGRLVDAFDVSYAQSLSVFALERERAAGRRPASRALLAMGAPQFASHRANADDTPRGARTASTLRALQRLNADWAPLPDALKELRGVARLFPAAEVDVLAGRDATEDALHARNRSGALRRYRYLLFSTHGLLDPEEPALSALILGRASADSPHDGYVTALEWLDYQVQSDLIVLSACSSGEGRLLKGEGVLGLPYAMFVAGNRDALLTLWPVADAGTREFVTRFFALVRAGRSHAQSLTQVKREFARDRRYRAPRYWAAFVLYGS